MLSVIIKKTKIVFFIILFLYLINAPVSASELGSSLMKSSKGMKNDTTITLQKNNPGDSATAPKNVLTLKDCLQNAIKNHPRLQYYRYMTKSSKYRVKQAASGKLPKLVLNADHYHSEAKSTTTTGEVVLPYGKTMKSDTYSSGIRLEQNICDFGRTDNAVKIAKSGSRQWKAEYEENLQDTFYRIIESYYLAYAARQEMEVEKEGVLLQEYHLKKAVGFHKSGVKPKFEVIQAESALSDARLGFIESKEKAETAYLELLQNSGITPGENSREIQLPLESPATHATSDLTGIALKNRPDIKKIEEQIRQGKLEIDYAFSQMNPELKLTAGYSFNDRYPKMRYGNWGYGLNLNFDLFDGGYKSNIAKEAKEKLKGLLSLKEDLKQQVTVEIKKAQTQLETSKARVRTSIDNTAFAKESFRLAKRRYEEGLGDYLEFQNARLALTKAKKDRIIAEVSLRLAYARLLRCCGILNHINSGEDSDD